MNQLFANLPTGNLLGVIKENGVYDYQQAAKLVGINSKKAVAKAAGIPELSVRYDDRMSVNLKEFFNEIISVLSIVAKEMNNDKDKVRLWFSMPNPVLGGVSPSQMILIGKYKKLLKFIERSLNGEMA